jgi:hypothetical protein
MAKNVKSGAPSGSSAKIKTDKTTSVTSTNHGAKLQGKSVNADSTRSSVAKSHSLGGRTA